MYANYKLTILRAAGCGLRAIYNCCLVMRSLHKKTEMIKSSGIKEAFKPLVKFLYIFFVLCIHQQNMIIEYMHMYVYMKLIDSKIAMP